jgi:hypothetical protein
VDVVKSSAEYRIQVEKWCEELFTLDGRKEDADELVGRAEALISKQEFGEAVRVLDKAFEISGRGDWDVRIFSVFSTFVKMWVLTLSFVDPATVDQGSKAVKAEQKQRLL